MTSDYEAMQRRAEKAEMELETLVVKCGAQREELMTLEAKVRLQESKLHQASEDCERRVQQLRSDLIVVSDQRESLCKEVQTLRAEADAQRCKSSESERTWQARLKEVRREQEETITLREAELQRAVAHVEERLSIALNEARRLEEANTTLEKRLSDMRECMDRQDEMRQRLENALAAQRHECSRISEATALEKQASHERHERVVESYKTELLELRRSYQQLQHEKAHLEEEKSRAVHEVQLSAQLERGEHLVHQQQLERTNNTLRAELVRERLRFDDMDESRQRTEAALVRSQRELESLHQRAAALEETIADLKAMETKHLNAQARLEGQVTRLLSTVAEREREAEHWRCAAERVEWNRHLVAWRKQDESSALFSLSHSAQHLAGGAAEPSMPSPVNCVHYSRRTSCNATPQNQQQFVESIDKSLATQQCDSTGLGGIHNAEDEVEFLRTMVQKVLQEHFSLSENRSGETSSELGRSGSAMRSTCTPLLFQDEPAEHCSAALSGESREVARDTPVREQSTLPPQPIARHEKSCSGISLATQSFIPKNVEALAQVQCKQLVADQTRSDQSSSFVEYDNAMLNGEYLAPAAAPMAADSSLSEAPVVVSSVEASTVHPVMPGTSVISNWSIESSTAPQWQRCAYALGEACRACNVGRPLHVTEWPIHLVKKAGAKQHNEERPQDEREVKESLIVTDAGSEQQSSCQQGNSAVTTVGSSVTETCCGECFVAASMEAPSSVSGSRTICDGSASCEEWVEVRVGQGASTREDGLQLETLGIDGAGSFDCVSVMRGMPPLHVSAVQEQLEGTFKWNIGSGRKEK
uniref:Uncharacterized protein n=1 Tax=Trypanosoma vivax (strain Y486) TaxID=1055687 RepID=G0TRF9_TRYVY|nr:conserved hypothetical protein [Trypanosoma vivax Y486]